MQRSSSESSFLNHIRETPRFKLYEHTYAEHIVTVDTKPTAIYGCEVLLAVGIETVLQSAYFVTAAKVLPSEVLNTVGFINVVQIGSTAIGPSIAAVLFQNLGYQNLRSALAGMKSVVLEMTLSTWR